MNRQTGRGDYTLLYNNTLYKFPTEQELWEFLREEAKANENDTPDALIVGVQPAS